MTTACIDWQDRIINRRSLIVAPPLYPDEAAEALEMFKSLRVVGGFTLTILGPGFGSRSRA